LGDDALFALVVVHGDVSADEAGRAGVVFGAGLATVGAATDLDAEITVVVALPMGLAGLAQIRLVGETDEGPVRSGVADGCTLPAGRALTTGSGTHSAAFRGLDAVTGVAFLALFTGLSEVLSNHLSVYPRRVDDGR